VVVALLAACAVAGLGVVAYGTHRQRVDEAAEQERYGDVLAAATTEAEAVVNLSYRDAEAGLARVAAGATGDLRDRYDGSAAAEARALRRQQSVMAGQVVWAGVVDLVGDRATVIAATSGTLTSTRTGDDPVTRDLRLRLDLVRTDGSWLTSDLEVVR
jgi:Mce-associated membrane protein